MFSHIKELFTRPSGYSISRSVRLRSSASAYFNRTPAGATNRTTWTWSGWVKRGSLGTAQMIFQANAASGTTDNDRFLFYFNSSNQLEVDGALQVFRVTNAVFRDPSAWYHIVLTVDTGNATTNNRMLLYVNGVSQSFSTNYALSSSQLLAVNGVYPHYFSYLSGSSFFFDGYLTEINFIDGQALTPSSFGETDSITGVWKAKKYGGTYGTNGFYLNFSDNSSNTATTIGKDYSGNGNNWTPNNISVTAGVTYDSMQDVPTLTSATAANFCVMNPLNLPKGGTLSNGNLLWTSPTTEGQAVGTMYVSSGKFYWEMVLNTAGSGCAFGIASNTTDINNINLTAGSYVYYTNGNKYNGGTGSAYGATFTNGDIIGVALDLDAGTLVFYKNNTSQGTAFTGLSGTFTALIYDGTSASAPTFNANFGQQPFTYTPPTGFVALNTNNLPVPTIKNGAGYMAATLYTGNGSTQSISNAVNGTSFQPDLVWVKGRSVAYSHGLYDSVRGVNKRLISNLTNAEDTLSGVSAFSSGGFSLGSDINFNQGSATYVGWQWKANGSAVTNTAGSITSQVNAGATQGFSVVTYTGTGANATVGHGLGVAPSMIIIKQRSTTTSWAVYHSGLTSAAYVINLNLTSGQAGPNTVFWNSTAPTSTVFSLGTGTDANASGATAVAYCFAAVAGYSSAFSYTGNGSADGPFVFLGFRTRWVMVKNTTTAGGGWEIFDTSTGTTNPLGSTALFANLSDAEQGFGPEMDILSNGIKIRRATATRINSSGDTFIGFAFAESPFKTSLAR